MDEPRSDDIFYRNDVGRYPQLVLNVPNLEALKTESGLKLLAPFFESNIYLNGRIEVKIIEIIERSTVMKAMTFSQTQQLDEVYKGVIRAYKLNMIRINLLTKLYKELNETSSND